MPRRVMEGRIVGDKSNKTVTVLVERRIMDPIYKKFIRRSKKFAAHDESNVFRVGDYVSIEECAPISKSKRWKVISAPPANSSERPKKAFELKPEPVKKPVVKKALAPKPAKAPKAEAPAPAETAAKKPVKAKTEKTPKVEKSEKAEKAAPKTAAKKKTKDES